MQGPYLIYLDLSSSSTAPATLSPAFSDIANASFVTPSSAAVAPFRRPGMDGIEGMAGIAGIAGIDGIVGMAALPNHPLICDLTFENIPPDLVGLQHFETTKKASIYENEFLTLIIL